MGVGLLLILGALQGSLSQSVHVYQIPAVTTTPGKMVTLLCNYSLSIGESPHIAWLKWYRHMPGGPEVSNSDTHFRGRVSRANQNDFIIKRSASIGLHRVDLSDTGMYICQVGLHYGNISGTGNGTFLNVTAFSSSATKNEKFLKISLSIVAVLILISIFVSGYVGYSKWTASRNNSTRGSLHHQPENIAEDHHSLENENQGRLYRALEIGPHLLNGNMDIYSEIGNINVQK